MVKAQDNIPVFKYTDLLDISPQVTTESGLYVYTTPGKVATASRQGALYLGVTRTTAMTSTDGNPDTGLKIQVQERASGASYHRARAIDASARIYNSVAGYSANCVYLTSEVSTGATATSLVVGEFHMKNNGVTSGAIEGVLIQDDSQGTTAIDDYYGLLITTANYNPTRTGAIKINSAGTSGWTNGVILDGVITNVLKFEDTDGTNGATLKAGTYSGSGNTIAIRVMCGTVAYYLIAHATVT